MCSRESVPERVELLAIQTKKFQCGYIDACEACSPLTTAGPAGELEVRGCQPMTSTACAGADGGGMGIGMDSEDIGGVLPIPRMDEGEDDDWSSYAEPSGNGAPVLSPALPSFVTGNTPACEKGYRGTPISSGCTWEVMRTISVVMPCRSFSCRAARKGSVSTRPPKMIR